MDKIDSLYIQNPLRKKLYTSKTGKGNNLDLAAGLQQSMHPGLKAKTGWPEDSRRFYF